LSDTDVKGDDRMNFSSVLKIIDDIVLEALKKHVPGSEGTVVYLENLKAFASALMDKSLTPLERIYRLWREIFF